MKRITGMILLLAVSLFVAGCGHGPKYKITEDFTMPADAKIGMMEQVKCLGKCTEENNPKLYTDTMKARLESQLNKPVTLIPYTDKFDYSAAQTAVLGKAAGVDFVIGGSLDAYNDPSSASRAGSFAITTITSVLPIMVMHSQRPSVSSSIVVVRTADAKVVGTYGAHKSGGNFAKCTSLTEDIADDIVEQGFTVAAK